MKLAGNPVQQLGAQESVLTPVGATTTLPKTGRLMLELPTPPLTLLS